MEHHDEQHQEVVCIGSISSSSPPSSSSSPSCDKLPPLLSSQKYPWFIVQNLEEEGIDREFLSTLDDPPLVKYKCQIPELYGRRVRGCFHGWLILSNHPDNVIWSLWNPVSLKVVRFPPLILKDGDGKSIDECLLTGPPEDSDSVLLLRRCDAPTFVFCRLLNCKKKKRMKWTEMSYAKQLKKMTYDGQFLHSLTCCNHKIYALNSDCLLFRMLIQVDIVPVKGKGGEVIIQLVMFGASPSSKYNRGRYDYFIKGYGTELFCVKVYYLRNTKKIVDVKLFRLDIGSIKSEELECLKKWDVTDMIMEETDYEDLKDLDITQVMWEEMNDLKDGIFYADLGRDGSIYYNPTVGPELGGGYIHIRDKMDEIVHLYHVRDRTIIPSPMPSRVVSTTHLSMWEGTRLEGDGVEAKCTTTFKQEKDVRVVTLEDVLGHDESRLHNIPFDVLRMSIIERCVGVEYLNMRATCKLCRLAAPPIRWSNESSLRRLDNYSLNSPWLMVFDEHRGIVSFTDPVSGDNYFMKKNPHVLSFVDNCMYCSRYGWLLFESTQFECPVFFNPFTRDVLKLPESSDKIGSLCFSSPPNSSNNNCIVAGFAYDGKWQFIYSIVGGGGRAFWYFVHVDDDECKESLTFIGRDVYALGKDGEVILFKNLGEGEVRKTVLAKAPPPPISSGSSSAQYFLMNFDDEHVLLVIVGDQFGEVEVFKRNDDEDKWEKIDSIGKHTIYIGGATSVCVDAKTPEMENKIYFPQLVWYSLETHTYHSSLSSDGGKIMKKCLGGFLGAKSHTNIHAWIQPSWC